MHAGLQKTLQTTSKAICLFYCPPFNDAMNTRFIRRHCHRPSSSTDGGCWWFVFSTFASPIKFSVTFTIVTSVVKLIQVSNNLQVKLPHCLITQLMYIQKKKEISLEYDVIFNSIEHSSLTPPETVSNILTRSVDSCRNASPSKQQKSNLLS